MFCNQCEQVARGVACDKIGVCGKTPEVAALQDLLLHAVKGLSLIAVEARKFNISDERVNRFTAEAVFSTLTNVDFDAKRFENMLLECENLKKKLEAKLKAAGGRMPSSDASFIQKIVAKLKGDSPDFKTLPNSAMPASDLSSMISLGGTLSIPNWSDKDPDISSLKQIIIYGLKGVAAYADHAAILGKEDEEVYAFMHEALAATLDTELSVDELLGLVLKCGEINLKAMELLDAANTGTYGHPVPTPVPLGHKKGKAILVSGHDLKDLELLLKHSEGKGIYIYTHGEMLPCHAYPELKKYKHFYGHYGTAWQNQTKEFDAFPGAILMTTNCIQAPRPGYKDNIFTTGLVGFPEVKHISDKDFTPLIEKALALPGFSEDKEDKEVLTGFARNTVLSVADTVVNAVKAGDIRHFFLVGGCDGAKPGRNYYTELVEKIPSDCLVLTLACGKFRFFDKDLGKIGDLPRLLDVGQCNDAYSAIQIAVALASAFECEVNDLPLSMILSWYEQKAVAILLTLLYLGIKDIRLGPTLPAFISENVLNVLVEKFAIKPIAATPEEDLKAILG